MDPEVVNAQLVVDALREQLAEMSWKLALEQAKVRQLKLSLEEASKK